VEGKIIILSHPKSKLKCRIDADCEKEHCLKQCPENITSNADKRAFFMWKRFLN
jgi:hypothetical protein